MGITFRGERVEPLTCCVEYCVEGGDWKTLPPYLSEVNHSPTGFEWGYGGSGPAQLAYAILRTVFGKTIALSYYGELKWDVVAKFSKEGFVLSENQVREWVKRQEVDK